MNITITARKLELSDALREYIAKSLEALSLYQLEIISASVVASTETKKSKESHSIELVLHIAGKNSIVISQADLDMYAAIDKATDRAKKALRRIHDKENYHYKDGLNEAKASSLQSTNLSEASEALEDEIVPVRLELYKPREPEDVLNDLKESGKLFEIFLDNDGKTRVLYKRNDGRFGLY